MKINFTFKKKKNLQFIMPTLNSFFNCHNPKRIKLVTRLRTGLRHLCEYQFKHSFQDSLNPICRCCTDVESCVHFFLHYPQFQNEKLIFLSIVKNIDIKLLDYSDLRLAHILLFGDTLLHANTNSSILNATIDFVISSTSFF